MEFCWFVPSGVNHIFALSQTLTRVKSCIRFVTTHILVLRRIPRFKKGWNCHYLGMGFYLPIIWNEKDLYKRKTDHSGKYVIPLWHPLIHFLLQSMPLKFFSIEFTKGNEERLKEDSVLNFRYNSSSEGSNTTPLPVTVKLSTRLRTRHFHQGLPSVN